MYISLSVHSSHRHLRRDKQTQEVLCRSLPPKPPLTTEAKIILPQPPHPLPNLHRPPIRHRPCRNLRQTNDSVASRATADRRSSRPDEVHFARDNQSPAALSRRMPRTDLATARSRPTPSPPSSRRPSPVPCRRLPLHNPRLVPPQHDPRKCPLPLYSSAKAWSTHAGSPSLRAMPSPCPRRCSSWRASTLLSIS